MDKDAIEQIATRSIVAKGNAIYAAVVFDGSAAPPIVIQSQEPMFLPPLGEYCEVRQAGRRIAGKVAAKETLVVDQGLTLNFTTSVVLKP